MGFEGDFFFVTNVGAWGGGAGEAWGGGGGRREGWGFHVLGEGKRGRKKRKRKREECDVLERGEREKNKREGAIVFFCFG